MVTASASAQEIPHMLDGVSTADVIEQPYAHLVRRNALSNATYEALESEFPSLAKMLGGRNSYGNNEAVRLSVRQVLGDNQISRRWKDFFAYHTSQDYWLNILRVFGPRIRQEFPRLEERVGRRFEEWRVIPRGYSGDADVRLDCQFVMNTPVIEVSSVKTPHVDLCDKIFSSLYYFRSEQDKASGGDLDLYAWRRTPRFVKHRALLQDIDLSETVAYTANTFVCFVNSEKSVHGVSPRGVTTVPRRYINFIAELPIHAFQPKQVSRWRKLWLSKEMKLSASNDIY
ncbi:MAG TPA: 2OG-Fe(II) oxygenase [Dongiaceae bacterium]|nr:2OG-Fe(II) oxygenase [Dongiaceae bacterium]